MPPMRPLPRVLSVRLGTLTPSVMICAADSPISKVDRVTMSGGTLR